LHNVTIATPSARRGSSNRARSAISSKLAFGSDSCLTVKPLPGEGIIEMLSWLAVALKDSETTPVSMTIFGSVAAQPSAIEAMRRVFGPINWPVTWVEGASRDDRPVAGIHATVFKAGRSNPVILDGQVVGSVFEDGAFRHCRLGGLGPSLFSASRADQFRRTLDNLADSLDEAGFALGDLARTWYFLDDILSWYAPFNEARTEAYSRIKFRSGSAPASTGVDGRNPAGNALVVAAWALQPLAPSALVAEVGSPMQCPAPAYGSSFSRAMEFSSLLGRRITISGTASIAPGGETVWPGDLRKQIDLSMQVVEAILTSRGFALTDICRATAYFKDRAQIPAFAAWCAARHLLTLPVIAVQCGICRDDLLFEIEADAWK
jgi:enamine deaminase RidA (YjgF/YER057c/UK114 family)